jgi:hypothetical protein
VSHTVGVLGAGTSHPGQRLRCCRPKTLGLGIAPPQVSGPLASLDLLTPEATP